HSPALHSSRLMRETWNCMLNLLAKVVHRRLLRPRRERPCNRSAAEQRYELTPCHSITSSARASSVGGTSRPSRQAILRQGIRSPAVLAPALAPRPATQPRRRAA